MEIHAIRRRSSMPTEGRTVGQTDRHDESNSCFSQIFQRAWKLLQMLMWSLESVMDIAEYNNFLIIRRQKLRQNALKMYFLSHRERKISSIETSRLILLRQITDIQCVNCTNDDHALACSLSVLKKVGTCTNSRRLCRPLSYVRVVTHLTISIATVNTSNCPSLWRRGTLDANHGEDLQ